LIVVGVDDERQRVGVEQGRRSIDGVRLAAAIVSTGRLRAIIERLTAAVIEGEVGFARRVIEGMAGG
jgi:hypothetical protein